MDLSLDTTPVRSLEDLLRGFHGAETPRSNWLVGTEAEKFGVYAEDSAPLRYETASGVGAVFQALVDRHGWVAEREHAEGAVIALRRGAASITLEPGCQLELSGAPLATIHETSVEFSNHLDELREISEALGVVWLGLGFQPFAPREAFDWVPKLRYEVMRAYLPTRGENALDMMLRTATVQANFDYASEADAMRKLRAALRLSPIVTAMFANSPWVEGKATGWCSARARTWLAVDPDRSGLLPFAWQPATRYRDYVEWALDVPMFLIKRGAERFPNTGQTFRTFMNDGFRGLHAQVSDWQLHLNTLFPEVRLKGTLEVRGADAQGRALTAAIPALWKGLLYDDAAFERAEQLTEAITPEAAEAARRGIAERGLRAVLSGRPLAEWASEVLSLAEAGLRRCACLNEKEEDESVYLAPLRRLVDEGQTPAEALLRKVAGAKNLEEAIVAHAEL